MKWRLIQHCRRLPFGTPLTKWCTQPIQSYPCSRMGQSPFQFRGTDTRTECIIQTTTRDRTKMATFAYRSGLKYKRTTELKQGRCSVPEKLKGLEAWGEGEGTLVVERTSWAHDITMVTFWCQVVMAPKLNIRAWSWREHEMVLGYVNNYRWIRAIQNCPLVSLRLLHLWAL